MISLNANTLTRHIDCRQQSTSNIQLVDAVQQQDLQRVRDIISADSKAKQNGRESLERTAVEKAIVMLLKDDSCRKDCKADLLKELARYDGFDRRRIPRFVFKLEAHDKWTVILSLFSAGTAPRIGKGNVYSTEVAHLIKPLQTRLLESYMSYCYSKVKKHNLKIGIQDPMPPFFYKKRDRKINLDSVITGTTKNDKSVPYSGKHIVEVICGKVQEEHPTHHAFKERLAIFSDKEKAAATLNSIGYETLDALSKTPAPSVQCSNAEFGKLLYKLSGTLKVGQSVSCKLRFQASEENMQTMALHVYKNKENGRLGVGVYDPNVTANMKHAEYGTMGKEIISKLNLQHFIAGKYPIMPDTFSVSRLSEEFAKKHAGKLVGQDLQRQVDSLWDALAVGSADHIRAIAHVLEAKDMTDDQLASLLRKRAANADSGLPGVFAALALGHAEALKAFGDLLALLSEKQRSIILPGLLSAKYLGRFPGLFEALRKGHEEAVKVYGELLTLIPENQRTAILPDLLAAKDDRQATGLCAALVNGHAGGVKAYGRLLALIPEDQRTALLPELLAARNPNMAPGLYYALGSGHAEAVKAYGELLALIPEDQRTALLPELLAARNSKMVSGLYFALTRGHTGTVKAFGDLLKLIPDHQRAVVLPELLAVKNDCRIPGLASALAKGHAETVKAFGGLLTLIPEDQRSVILPELLAAQNLNEGGDK